MRVMSLTLLFILSSITLALLSGCATRHTFAPHLADTAGALKKTYYQGELRTEDNTLIRFTVFQPALKPGETAPLIMQGNPFGFWRLSGRHTPISHILTTGDVMRDAWDAGYWVLSWDQRGHGDSGDEMHIADPRKEGRDISQLIDWAQKNLAITSINGDPRVGMMGESMGAGVQLVASAIDPRIDALVPIAPWYDLESSLAPNQVPKSGWLSLLVLAGNTIADLDASFIPAYWHARGGVIDSWVMDEFKDHDVEWFCNNGQPPHADALIIQGFRDVLFPVNNALDIRACMQKAGRDVRVVGIDGGHLLPVSQHTPGWVIGWHVEKELNCNGTTQRTRDVIMNWFEGKLRDRQERLAEVPTFCLTGDALVDAAGAPPAAQTFEIARAHVGSGASGMIEWMGRPLDRVGNLFVSTKGRDWQKPGNGWLRPARVPLHRAEKDEWVVGVPRVSITVDNTDRDDPMLFLQVAAWRPGAGSYRVLSEQVTPIRGSGKIETDLMAVRGKIKAGEVVGLLVRGYQEQYRFSGSGWGTDASISGSIDLPMAAASVPAGKASAAVAGN